MKKIWAIILTFNPSTNHVKRILDALQRQVDFILVVDNHSRLSVIDDIRSTIISFPYVRILRLSHNTGVAAGFNAGIIEARKNGASHIILFDQDSVPYTCMVHKLLLAEEQLIVSGHKVAAVGPTFIDERTGSAAPFIQINGFRVRKVNSATGGDIVFKASYLISSGSLIRCEMFDRVGMFMEELFIDYVDIEWGLRAYDHGYHCFGVAAAFMQHAIGDRMVSIPFLKKEIPLHSPRRDYYLMRNAVFLYRKHHIPGGWKLADGIRLPLRFIFYAATSKSRLKHLRMMLLGLT